MNKLKNNCLFVLIMLCFIVQTEAQSRFSVGLTFSPNYSYRIISPKTIGSVRSVNKDIPIYTSTYGLNVIYYFSDKINLRTCLLYSGRGTKSIIYKEQFPDNTFFNESAVSIFKYNYFDIPIEFQFNVLKRESIRWYFTGGIAANIFHKSYYISIIDNVKNPKKDESDLRGFPEYINQVILSVNAGSGIMYSINNFEVMLHPVLRMNILSMLNKSYSNELSLYHYTIGLELGVFYKLGKAGEEQKEKELIDE